MKIYDLSPLIYDSMAVWRNLPEKRSRVIVTKTIKDGSNESKIEIEAHAGSHVDAPYHFLSRGKTIEKISLEKFMGTAIVLDFTKIENVITKNHLKNKKINKNDIVLLKTKNKPDKQFNFSFTYLEKSGAEYLASKKVKAVGIDSLGIEREQPNHETHKLLLKNNIPIFEGLDLSKVKQGNYFFYGLPLKIKKGDASPVRAILLKR